MYLYQWQADAEGRFDAGLIRPDGSSRPALDVVRTQLAAMAGPSPTPGARRPRAAYRARRARSPGR